MILFFWNLQFAEAQMIFDTLDLAPFEVFSNVPEKAGGFKVTEVDTFTISNHTTQSLAELLASSTPFFIKNYGPGSLATTSLRGVSATHTQVLWNGININSPMPGQADFSQIPVFFTDNIQICFGGGSLQQSSGGLGGNIEMVNNTDWNNTLHAEILQEAGSFGTYKTYLSARAGNRKFQSATRAFYSFSENDFPYLNNAADRENPPVEYRRNAAWKQQGLLQEFSFKPSGNTTLSARIWAQDNQREIPANIQVIVADGNEKLAEKLVRSQLAAEHFMEKSKISLQSSYAVNRMYYRNIISEIDDENTVKSWLNAIKYENYKFNRLSVSSGINYNFHAVNSENYEDGKFRKEASAFLGLNYQLNSWIFLNGSARQEVIDEKIAPVAAALGVKAGLTKLAPVYLKANISRNFHAPTLNDLFWMPGGNPDLKFEKGLNSELGFSFAKDIEKLTISSEITGFYANIDDWIMWQPDSIFSYWTPVNLKNVVSKGIEAGLKLELTINQLRLNYSLNYSFTQARNQKAVSASDLSVGKQLIYVPAHAANQNIRFIFRQFTLNYTCAFTGKLFTSSDNSRYLPSFALHDFSVSKALIFRKSTLTLKLDVNNLFDKSYQVIAWQPMPGRYFSFTLKFSYLK